MLRGRSGHDRARELAAIRVDEPLAPADEAFLQAHLAGCEACAAVAEGYEADRSLLAGLRGAEPRPPRDLWARTAAAIDAEAFATRPAPAGRRRRVLGLPVASLAPIAAAGVVTVVVGSTLFSGAPAGPVTAPSGPAPTAIATGGGQVAVVSRNADGSLEVRTVDVDEVCPLVNESCGAAAPSVESSLLAGIAASDHIDAIISPSRDRIVVVQRTENGPGGVFVVPVRPATAGVDPGGASPTASDPGATASVPVATATIEPSSDPSAPPTTDPSAGPDVSATAPASSDDPVPTDDPGETGEPLPSEAPSEAPPTDPAGSAGPDASPTPEATVEPTPTPAPSVAVTPAPDGALEIASDVIVVGTSAAYNRSGSRFAFTARPADDVSGPDVYVWNTDEARARAITSDHRSMFAGWSGADVLVSRVVDGAPRTVALNPRTGAEQAELGSAWLPTVAPGGTHAIWWDGSVRLAADGVSWVPDRGRLVLGPWGGDPGQTQVLSRGDVAAWEVQWTPDGRAVAVWTSASRGNDAGRLSLYRVDPDSGRADLDEPLLHDERAFAGFSLAAGQLAFAAPRGGDGRRVWVLYWEGTSVGKVELPDDVGATLVR